MDALKKFEGPADRRQPIDLSEHFRNIDDCLQHFRALKLYTDNALDKITLDLQSAQSRFRIDATLYSTAQSKAVTAAIVELIERQMVLYHRLCVLYGAERRFNIIRLKYFELSDDVNDDRYTNDQLADYFDCSTDTIKREIRAGKNELEILLFGAYGLN